MMPIDADNPRTTERNRDIPVVRLPVRQAQLRRGLVALSRESRLSYRGGSRSARGLWAKLGAASAVAAVAGSVALFFLAADAPGPPVALATLEVNPAITMSVDAEGRVAGLAPLDARAAGLLRETDLAGADLGEALQVISDILEKSGYMEPKSTVAVAVRPAQGADEADARRVSARIEDALRAAPDHVRVVVVTLSARDFDYLEDRGLLPGDYAPLVADGATVEAIRAMIVAQGWSDLDSAPAKETFAALVESANEMVELGVTHADALTLLEAAIAARLAADDLTEVVAVYEDLVDAGVTPEVSLALLRSAIDAGLGTDGLWELVDAYEALTERGLPAERVQEQIERQLADGWDAEAAVKDAADPHESEWEEERRESEESDLPAEDADGGDEADGE